jgi:hypothetical protein
MVSLSISLNLNLFIFYLIATTTLFLQHFFNWFVSYSHKLFASILVLRFSFKFLKFSTMTNYCIYITIRWGPFTTLAHYMQVIEVITCAHHILQLLVIHTMSTLQGGHTIGPFFHNLLLSMVKGKWVITWHSPTTNYVQWPTQAERLLHIISPFNYMQLT